MIGSFERRGHSLNGILCPLSTTERTVEEILMSSGDRGPSSRGKVPLSFLPFPLEIPPLAGTMGFLGLA